MGPPAPTERTASPPGGRIRRRRIAAARGQRATFAPTIADDLVQAIKDLAAGGMGLFVVEQSLGVATSLAERQLVMMTGQIATKTTAAELGRDPAAQRRYLGVEPLPDAV